MWLLQPFHDHFFLWANYREICRWLGINNTYAAFKPAIWKLARGGSRAPFCRNVHLLHNISGTVAFEVLKNGEEIETPRPGGRRELSALTWTLHNEYWWVAGLHECFPSWREEEVITSHCLSRNLLVTAINAPDLSSGELCGSWAARQTFTLNYFEAVP